MNYINLTLERWTELKEFINSWPKEVWAALIAAGIASIATAMSNRNARRIIGMQLRDAAKQAEDKRKMDLRREVFFPAVKAVTDITSIIGALMDVSIPNEKIRETYTKALGDIAGVHIIAAEKTLSAVIEMNHYIANLYFDLTLSRAKLTIETQKLNAISAVETTEIQNGTALLELMKQHNLGGGTPDQWAKIQRQWEIHQQLLQGHALKRAEQYNIALRFSSDMLKQFSEHMEEIFPLQAKSMIAIREELGLPMDESEYMKYTEKARQAARAATIKAADFLVTIAQH